MKVKIWQILTYNPKPRKKAKIRFLNYESTVSRNGGVDSEGYSLVYNGELDTEDLERVYTILNTCPPVGYAGEAMSVSDVVEVEGVGCFFCDSVGFKAVPDFHKKKKKKA